MNKKLNLAVIILAVIGVPLVYAANVHFKKAPTFSDQGTTLRTCFSLAGLGMEDVTITVKTTGSATTICTISSSTTCRLSASAPPTVTTRRSSIG